jgi:hypothetical protein
MTVTQTSSPWRWSANMRALDPALASAPTLDDLSSGTSSVSPGAGGQVVAHPHLDVVAGAVVLVVAVVVEASEARAVESEELVERRLPVRPRQVAVEDLHREHLPQKEEDLNSKTS